VGYMMRYPVFGIGIHNFTRAEGTISEKAYAHVVGTGLRWAAPHNSYVEVGAELGIPGLILWSSLVFGGMAGVFRMHRLLPREWRRGNPEQRFLYALTASLPIALLGFAVTSSFVSFAYLDPIYILAAMVSGTYLLVPRHARVPHAIPVSQRSRRAARALEGATARGQLADPSQLG
jgi:O-antigen ligase